MRTRMALGSAVIALAFLGVSSAPADFVVQFDPDDANRVTGIRDLDVGGTPYDFAFTPSTTAALVYGDSDLLGNDYDFNTSAAAELAVNAVVDALDVKANAGTVGSLDEGSGSILFRVPFDSDVDTVLFGEGTRNPPGPWVKALKPDGDAYN